MRQRAIGLPDTQSMEDVAGYIATLPGGRPPAAVNGDAAMGADYFNQFCGACHERLAEGNLFMTAIAPTLAGASDWYLITQLRVFRAGIRGVHENDRVRGRCAQCLCFCQTIRQLKTLLLLSTAWGNNNSLAKIIWS